MSKGIQTINHRVPRALPGTVRDFYATIYNTSDINIPRPSYGWITI